MEETKTIQGKEQQKTINNILREIREDNFLMNETKTLGGKETLENKKELLEIIKIITNKKLSKMLIKYR